MRNVDLSKYNVRTDLVIDLVDKQKLDKIYYYKKIKVSNLKLKKNNKLKKEPGLYTTIYFNDITDSDNYENVLYILTKELKKILKKLNIKKTDSCMIIGLGNEKSTADELGVSVAKKIVVTKHINDLIGNLESGYRITSCFIPGVMANTGIETSDIVSSVIKKIKPDFIIVIDALASSDMNNLLKTIQITDTGIKPGSGIGNKRKEISKKIYNVPVIAIGVPTVVEASTIVTDTITSLKKFFKQDLFGVFENLEEKEVKSLVDEVIKSNLIVTPKDIDFIVLKLTNLISSAINNSIHNISTKNTK